jgi:CheY-like chemotaxis protein
MPAGDIGRMIRLLRAQPSTRRVAIVEMIGDSPLHDQRDAVDLVLERHRLHTLATELRSNLTLRADSELAEGQDSAGRGIPWNSAVFLAERMLLGVHRNDQVASLCVVRFDDKDPLGEIDAAQEVLVSEFRSDDIVTRSPDRETIAVLAGVDRQVAAGRLGSLVSRLTQVNARVAIVEFPFDARSVSDLVDGARSLLEQSLDEDGPKVVTSDWTAGQRREVDVIVADSDTPIALIITDALERCGLTVDRESDGQELLTRLLDPRIPLPRLLLLEFDLATIDGLTVLRRLKPKAALRRFDAMMLSTRTREIDLQQAFDLGASEIVQKPFSPAILVRRVLKLLDEQP